MAIVTEEGGAAHTINLCRNCYKEKKGKAEVNSVKWRALVEQKSSRGELRAAFGVDELL